MSKKKKNTKQFTPSDVTLYIFSIIVSVYCYVFFLAMPLLYHNKYYDIGDFKYKMFMYLTVCFLLCASIMLPIYLICQFRAGKFTKTGAIEVIKSLNTVDYFVFAFGLASILSFLLSPSRTSEYPTFFLFSGHTDSPVVNLPWEGYSGWNMGLRSQLMFVAIYFLVSRLFMKSWAKDFLYMMLGSSFIVFFLGVINRFRIDPLGVYENLEDYYISKFLSTLGQATWYSSFMVVVLPVGMAFFLFNDSKKSTGNILLGCYIAIGGATFVTQNSDSAYPAFAAIVMVMFAASFSSNDRFLKFLEMMIIMLGAMKVTGLFQILFPERIIRPDSISIFISQSVVTLLLLIILICFYVFMLKTVARGKFDITKYRFMRNAIVIAVVVCIPAGILIGYLNTKGMLPTDTLRGVEYLTFNDMWGNNRGYTWRNTVEVMNEPLWRGMALTGPGPDCYATVMYAIEPRASQLYSHWGGELVVCAHNEWLNMLFNEGILGFITYIGIFISAFVIFIRKCDNPVTTAGATAIMGYFFHNMFCYQQILCTPMIFCIIALCVYTLRNPSLLSSEQ